MARQRGISDEAVLDAANVVLRRVGPGQLTFALVAAESNLAAATLVQRFENKQKLVRLTLLRAWDRLDAHTATLDRVQHESPAGAISLLAELSGAFGEVDFADGLLLLREDFRDPQLRVRGEHWGDTLAQVLGRRLTGDTSRQKQLGQMLANQWQGAVVWWGYTQRQPLATRVRQELEAWWAVVGTGAPTPVEAVPPPPPEETPTDRIIRLYGDG